MRLLVLYQAADPALDQPGYFDGFERMVRDGELEAHIPVGYLGVASNFGWDGLWEKVYEIAQDLETDAIFLQFFHTNMPNPLSGISRIRALPCRPLFFTSLGDAFGRWVHTVPRSFCVASSASDLTFLTGMGHIAQQLLRFGSRNLVLMPNGCCQVRFANSRVDPSARTDFDVCFVGSKMRAHNPLSHFYWCGKRRVEFANAFTKRYGARFGLFGKGWEGNLSWGGAIPHRLQQDVYRKAEVVAGGIPLAYHDYYTSDRVFIATASGVPLIDYYLPGVDMLLRDRRDWWLAHNLDEMIALTDMLLEMPRRTRLELGEQTRHNILAHHTQYHRCQQMIGIVKTLLEARHRGGRAPLPQLPFLEPASSASQAGEAVIGWQG